jgi:hypothetical protein
MPIELFGKYLGEFRPRRSDDLKPDARQFIGTLTTWEAYWHIEDGETYAGEVAMVPVVVMAHCLGLGFVWVPSGDIQFSTSL